MVLPLGPIKLSIGLDLVYNPIEEVSSASTTLIAEI